MHGRGFLGVILRSQRMFIVSPAWRTPFSALLFLFEGPKLLSYTSAALLALANPLLLKLLQGPAPCLEPFSQGLVPSNSLAVLFRLIALMAGRERQRLPMGKYPP